MTIPPLSLVDNTLIVDNSTIEQLQTCPRSWLFKYGLRRIAAIPAPGRNFGSCIHEGLAARYTRYAEHQPPLEDVSVEVAMRAYMTANPPPENDFRTLDHALTVTRVYNEVYGNEAFKILAIPAGPLVEKSFLLPIGQVEGINICYAGKIDLGVRDTTGLWVIDHKTAFQFGQQFEKEMAMDTGQLGYCWAFSQIFGQRPLGYITNAIRVRKPGRKLDELGNINQTAPVDKTDFNRLLTVVTQEKLDEFVETVHDWARFLIRCHNDQRFPRTSGKKGCVAKYGVCEYYDVCNAPKETRENLLASSLFMDNEWTPLKKGSE